MTFKTEVVLYLVLSLSSIFLFLCSLSFFPLLILSYYFLLFPSIVVPMLHPLFHSPPHLFILSLQLWNSVCLYNIRKELLIRFYFYFSAFEIVIKTFHKSTLFFKLLICSILSPIIPNSITQYNNHFSDFNHLSTGLEQFTMEF